MGGDPTQVRGPDFKRLDLSIFKSFRGSGNQRFEFRVEIFNLTNTHNFSVPGFSGGGAVFRRPACWISATPRTSARSPRFDSARTIRGRFSSR